MEHLVRYIEGSRRFLSLFLSFSFFSLSSFPFFLLFRLPLYVISFRTLSRESRASLRFPLRCCSDASARHRGAVHVDASLRVISEARETNKKHRLAGRWRRCWPCCQQLP